MKIKIVSRWNPQIVLYECDADTLRSAVIKAVGDRAYLGGAYLRGAYLRGADLGDADLGGADLRDADLGGAYLGGAYLRDADLGGVYLRGAYLRGADLGGADLRGAPSIPNIHRTILAAVEKDGNSLNMVTWHTCETTHCRGGWAVVLAGKAGRALERQVGSASAATLIYLASGASQVPNWTASDEDAMADMRKWAAIEAVPSSALSWPEDAVKRWQDHQEAMWEKRRQKRDVEASVT